MLKRQRKPYKYILLRDKEEKFHCNPLHKVGEWNVRKGYIVRLRNIKFS